MPVQDRVRVAPGVAPGVDKVDGETGEHLSAHDLAARQNPLFPGWFEVVYRHEYNGEVLEHVIRFETGDQGSCKVVLPQHESLTYA